MTDKKVRVSWEGTGLRVYLVDDEGVVCDIYAGAYDQNGHFLEEFVLVMAKRITQLEQAVDAGIAGMLFLEGQQAMPDDGYLPLLQQLQEAVPPEINRSGP